MGVRGRGELRQNPEWAIHDFPTPGTPMRLPPPTPDGQMVPTPDGQMVPTPSSTRQ